MTSMRWTREQLKLAFNLYCQLPFGRLHSGNAEIAELAALIDRTPSAVAMKLVNFASLDPAITSTGRTGLGHASALDREVWTEFHADWESLAVECALLLQKLRAARGDPGSEVTDAVETDVPEDFSGESRETVTLQRVKQRFFRRAVLSSYHDRCCMSGLSDARLLIASHIVPWSKDTKNRLNPRNGLCLSALHDKAFDKGLITMSNDFRVIVSDQLLRRNDAFVKAVFVSINDRVIDLPDRFLPSVEFIARHRQEEFVDRKESSSP